MDVRSLRGLVGMPVVCGSRRIGRVLRAEPAEDLRQLDGIWISAGMRGTRYIPAESLELLGKVAVMAEDAGTRKRMTGRPLFRRAVSTDGQRLGAITGAEIDEVSFAVTALELSAGLWDDLLRSRERVTRYTVDRETGEVILETAGDGREATEREERTDEGAVDGDAHRRIGGDAVRRDELADRASLEPQGQADGQLDL